MKLWKNFCPARWPPPPTRPHGRFPPPAVLQERQLKLPALVRNAEQRADALGARVEALSAPAPSAAGVRPEGSLGRRLNSQLDELLQIVLAAQQAAATSLSEFRPILGRAKAEADALEQIIAWRGYVDIFGQGLDLERQVEGMGGGGSAGLFPRLRRRRLRPIPIRGAARTWSNARVAVRNLLQKSLEVLDVDTHASLGRSENGKIKVRLKLPESEETYEQTFRLSLRCDDALVQLGFIIDQIERNAQTPGNLLQADRVQADPGAGGCWRCFRIRRPNRGCAPNIAEPAIAGRSLVADLTASGRYKERIATYHLLQRCDAAVRNLIAAREAEQNNWKQSSKRTADIASRCSRDVETDRLIIPPKYAQAYDDEMKFREKTQREMQRIERLLKMQGDWVRERVSSARLAGRPELPTLQTLGALPEAMETMAESMSDEWILATVATLESLLNAPLPVKLQPAPAKSATTRPSAPRADEQILTAEPVHVEAADLHNIPMATPVVAGTSVAEPGNVPAVTDVRSDDEPRHANVEPAGPAQDFFIDDTPEEYQKNLEEDAVADFERPAEE